MGWTLQQEHAHNFAKILQKYVRHKTASADDIGWLLEKAAAKWGVAGTNSALKECIPKGDYKMYWSRIARQNTEECAGAVKSLRALKVWCQEQRDEYRLTKYLKSPGRHTTFEEHVRMMRYAKELHLVPKKRLMKYRQAAYAIWGKAKIKCAWRHAELRQPDRTDGPPHRKHTMNELMPEAIKKYQRLCQEGKDPMATNAELLSMFRKRTPEYGNAERGDKMYPGVEVDYLHCRSRPDGRTMPCDWLGEQASQVPPGKVIAFLGPRARCPYIIRDKSPEVIERIEYEEWIEEPFKCQVSLRATTDEVGHEPDARTAKPTRTQIRRAHRKAKAERWAEQEAHEYYKDDPADAEGKELEEQQKVEEQRPPRGRGSDTSEAQCETGNDAGKMIASQRPVYENPPPRGRRRALAEAGQHGVEDSGFTKMIAAKRRVEEVPPPRGRRKGRIKLGQTPYV
jgi:hypothetical protein